MGEVNQNDSLNEKPLSPFWGKQPVKQLIPESIFSHPKG